MNRINIPTHTQVYSLLSKRKKLIAKHSLLYRTALDIMATRDKDAVEGFVKWGKSNTDLNRFELTLYFIFVRYNKIYPMSYTRSILDFLEDNGYIQGHSLDEFSYLESFGSKNEAIRWIEAYHTTKLFLKMRLKKYAESTSAVVLGMAT